MDKQLANTIGAEARRARKELELTQEDAAERIGVSVEFYARIERGNALPSVPTFVRIANCLGTSADVLLGLVSYRAASANANWRLDPQSLDTPEMRRVQRLLRRASPATLRLVTMLVKEMEKIQGGVEPSEGGKKKPRSAVSEGGDQPLPRARVAPGKKKKRRKRKPPTDDSSGS